MSESQALPNLKSLHERLDRRARELQTAEVTIHTLKLEQLARDRQISDLKARLFALETAMIDAQAGTAAALRSGQAAKPRAAGDRSEPRAQEPELYAQLVAAAEQERATYLEYIEHLKAELAQRQPTE